MFGTPAITQCRSVHRGGSQEFAPAMNATEVEVMPHTPKPFIGARGGFRAGITLDIAGPKVSKLTGIELVIGASLRESLEKSSILTVVSQYDTISQYGTEAQTHSGSDFR